MTAARYWMDVRRWRSALRDAVELPIATRGVLFVLAQWMNADGSNAFPSRARLAASCQLSESAIDRHLAKAIGVGYLQRTSAGHKGHVATFAATIPAYRWNEQTGKIVQPLPVEVPQRAAPVTRNRGKSQRSRTHSAAFVTAKGRTSDAPTSRSTSDKHLAVDKSTGPLLRSGRDEDEDFGHQVQELEGANDEEQEPCADYYDDYPEEQIAAVLGGIDGCEGNIILAMLEDGYNAKAIVNTIEKHRRFTHDPGPLLEGKPDEPHGNTSPRQPRKFLGRFANCGRRESVNAYQRGGEYPDDLVTTETAEEVARCADP